MFITSHRAQATDFEEVKWLIQYGDTETWYEKPSNAVLKRMRAAESAGSEPDELPTSSAKAIEHQTPKIWASDALSTPLDDDVQGCLADHPQAQSWCKTCHSCGEAKSRALEATDLAYYLVFQSTQASDSFGPGSCISGGRQVYKLIKCGSKETAVAEAFHASGNNGWNLVFSCITRAGVNVGERGGKFKRVKSLWMLADDDADDDESVRVFY